MTSCATRRWDGSDPSDFCRLVVPPRCFDGPVRFDAPASNGEAMSMQIDRATAVAGDHGDLGSDLQRCGGTLDVRVFFAHADDSAEARVLQFGQLVVF